MLPARTISIVVALLVPVFTAVASPQSIAVSVPAVAERVTSVEGIAEYRLQNGLRVLLFPDRSKSTITVNVTYLVGSKHENYGETGMAHLLEHLLFKGSKRHPDVPKELQDHGARPNGTTAYDRTNYFETFRATDANLEWAVDLEADRMVNSFVSRKDLDSEMTVVRNEFEAGENSPFNVLRERVLSAAYLWHNYGKSVIGSRSDIENVSIDRLQAFYRTFYQPDNAILIVAGKIDETKALDLVLKYFGAIPRPRRTLPTIYTSEPTQDGERSVTLRRVGDVQHVIVAYHVPAGSHPDYAAFQVASLILTENAPSGRLYKALVETKKASNVGGGGPQLKDAGISIIVAEVRKESSLDDVRETLLATVGALKASPFTSEEVERARNRMLTSIDLQLNNSEAVALALSNWAAMGDWRLLFLNRDRLKAVALADIQRVAEYYTKSSNRTVGVFIPTDAPDRTEVPAAPDLVATFKDYKGGVGIAVGEAFDTSPEGIEARTRRLTLPGGTKVALVPKETRGDAVSAVLRLNVGDEKSLAGQSRLASLTAQMLMRGTTERTRQQIQDELDRLKARVGVSGGGGVVTVNIQTIREHLPTVLALVAEILRHPAFPALEFETLRQQALAVLENQETEPTAIVARAFSRHLGSSYLKGDIRYVPTLDEETAEIRGLTREQAQQFHTGFYGASHAEVAVVGDFDAETVLKVISTQLDGWKSPKSYTEVKTAYRKVVPASEVFETDDKANAMFLAGMTIKIRDDDPDYPALLFANYLMGQGINSRLFARIRGKEGLSYGIGSSLIVTPDQDNARFVVNAISAPENAWKVEASFLDELSLVLKGGFTEAEIDAGKKSWLQAQQLNRDQDPTLAGSLISQTHYGRTMAWDVELQNRVQALSSQDILAALRKHIDLNALTIMKGGDFKKAAPQ
jgi:zinc protease